MKQVAIGILSRTRDDGEEEYLLVSSRLDFGEFTGYFYPPGGTILEGDDERSTLVRKIKEEVGLTIVPLEKITETPGDIADQTIHWWLCGIDGDDVLHINNEALSAAGFFTREEMGGMSIWPATRKVFEEFIFTID